MSNDKLATCLNCNSDDLRISEHEDDRDYSYLSVKCGRCANSIRSYGNDVESAITVWNNHNDIPTMLQNLEAEIQALKSIQKARQNAEMESVR